MKALRHDGMKVAAQAAWNSAVTFCLSQKGYAVAKLVRGLK